MAKILEISPTTRHEGHSKLVLKVDEEGIIERGDWVSITPVRGIEKLAIGKPMEQVPKIASRACGICPVALTLAATEAIEASIHCEIPRDAHILRVIMLCANRLHNIALHNLMNLPDFFLPGTETRINPFSPDEPIRTVTRRIQRLRMIGQTVAQIAGGEAVHPSNPRIGGMYTNVSRAARLRMITLAKEAIPLAREQMEFMTGVLREFQGRDIVEIGGTQVAIPEKLGYHSLGYMATAPVYGTSSIADIPAWDPQRFTEIRPWDLSMGRVAIDLSDPDYPVGGTSPAGTVANPRVESSVKVPLYDGKPVEVGPRARMATFRSFDERGTIGQHIARQLEYMDDVYQMMNHIELLNPQGAVHAGSIPQGDGSTGWAANEAPRGSNIHFARVKHGKVLSYSMNVPTTWNIPAACQALRGAPWQLAEMVIRGYDPCFSCATHLIVMDNDRKIVARRLIQ